MHYYFDGQDEILQHWTRGLGAHYLPFEAIKKTTLEELQATLYLSYEEAKKIIGIRTKKPNLNLKKFFFEMYFDSLKIKRLTLYLY